MNHLSKKMASRLCARCDIEITKENDSREHIIANAIGGRRRVRGFLCKNCNSSVGRAWDAAAATQLNFLALHLTGRRDRGEVRAGDYTTLSGKPIRIHPDGHLTLPGSPPEVTDRGTQVEIRARVTTRREARILLQGYKRRFPKLDVEEAMRGIAEQESYLREPIKAVCNFGGPKAGRSVVKSAFALAVASGVAAQTCNNARSYLKTDDGEPCFGYYYERDLITNRPHGRAFHCAAIKGDPVSGRLFGYVELFSVYRMIVGLSDEYGAPPLFESYVIDPANGQELDLDFNLSLTDAEIRAAVSNQYDYTAGMVGAFQKLGPLIHARSFAIGQRRVAEAAWHGAIAELGLSPGQEMTPDIAMALSQKIVLRMRPFLEHYIATHRLRTS
jgi:hypothetical protein